MNPQHPVRTHRLGRFAAAIASLGLVAASASAGTVGDFAFEEGADGAGSTGAMISGVDSVTDSAGGDDTFRTFSAATAPTYSHISAAGVIPLTGATNDRSLSFDGDDDIFQNVVGPMRTGAYTDFTMETFVRFDSLGGHKTIVGRDDVFGSTPGNNGIAQSLFYLQKDNNQFFRVELTNASNVQIAATSTFAPEINTWYHVAAVGDATAGTLSLYVDGSMVASTAGFDGLYNPPNDSSWTIGRGEYAGNPVDFMDGYIDNVRFSDMALAPNRFLIGGKIPIANGSFESPDQDDNTPGSFGFTIDGWNQGTDTGLHNDKNTGGPGDPPVALDGEQMAFLGNGTSFTNIYQDVSDPLIGVDGAESYTFSIGLAIRNGFGENPGVDGLINVGIHDLNDGGAGLVITPVARNLLTNEFQYFSVTIPAATVMSGDTLRIFVDKVSGSLIVVDNAQLSVTIIPTPAALPAGLAMITLAAARRRRRR